MQTGRSLLAAALQAALPGWQIVASTRQLDSVRKPGTAVLWTNRREKAPVLGLDWFKDEMILQVLTAVDKPDQIEDDLDQLLLDVMEALEPLDAFTWTTAERVAVDETFNGWQLDITCIFQATPTTH